MASYTITGTSRLPGGVSPLVGSWKIRLLGGYALDDAGTLRAGAEPFDTAADGSVTITLPATTGDEYYTAEFRSVDGLVRMGPYTFTLTADALLDDIIATPTVPPLTPTLVAQAEAAAADAQAAADDAAASDRILAYAENVSNVGNAMGISPAGGASYGCVVAVLPTDQDVWLEWSAAVAITAGGQGALLTGPAEFGIATPAFVGGSMNYSLSTQPVTSNFAFQNGRMRLGAVTATRWFSLQGQVIREGSGSALTAALRNLNGTYGRSWLAAVAR